jgi:hypothetical protein
MFLHAPDAMGSLFAPTPASVTVARHQASMLIGSMRPVVRRRIPRPKLLLIDQLKAVDIDQPPVGDL